MTPLKRPSDWTIARVVPNRNAPQAGQHKVVDVAHGKPGSIKFGSNGGNSGVRVEIESSERPTIKEESGDEGAEWPCLRDRRKLRKGISSFARRQVARYVAFPSKDFALTGGRGVDHGDLQVRPESIPISLVRLPDTIEEQNALREFDAEADVFIDWLIKALPNEGDSLDHLEYVAVPVGNLSMDTTIEEIKENLEVLGAT